MRGLLVTVLAGLTACASNPSETALLPSVDVAIRRWLLCEECSEGELDSVLSHGDRAVDPLKDALDGPTEERRDNMRRQAIYLYARVADDTTTQARYAQRSVANYVATYQRRAIVALDSIDTAESRQALTDALRKGGYRDDVLRLLGEATSTVLSRIQGDSQHTFYDSLVSIDPTVEVRDSASHAALEHVPVRFLVESGGGSLTAADSLTDAAGRASVRWRLGAADSVNVLRASAAGRSVRFRAFGRPPPSPLRLVFLVQPRSTRRGEPMVPPVRIAVQDAMGMTQVNPGIPGYIRVAVMGTGTNIERKVVLLDGVAVLSGLEMLEPRHGLQLEATRPNTAPVVSDTFSILP